MSKSELREKMKTLAIISVATEIAKFEVDSYNLPAFALLPARAMYHFKMASIRATPAKLFRHDKPELDHRRVKRSNKGAKVLKVNHKEVINNV